MTEQKKYWVPALEKAHDVLMLISRSPGKNKLIDLSNQLGINKSSMFSLLHTLEALQWVHKNEGEGYSIGSVMADFGYSFLQGFDLQERFREEASLVRDRLGETIQMSKLDGSEIWYLGKVEAITPFRLVSEPGMRMPAHSTAMGKALLAFQPREYVESLYKSDCLQPLTVHTAKTKQELMKQLDLARERGYALDMQEAVLGIQCVAAPIFNRLEQALYAVSCSMPVHHWEEKAERATLEICELARKLSRLN
ncbi:IclR family transcriptional regulator [Cohnella luojiensis]|uniref:IclR family transcriptional regulator n=1 Tax=Cohnella luojiensis TaxID=652876 RepID=A0A4Y8M2Z5_9BACL|nr:IclR family transcriptional regulator [Cohnella luojiensis]TFE29494.1 IclR family transcriptional regulator [Cohnella luojiensis]